MEVQVISKKTLSEVSDADHPVYSKLLNAAQAFLNRHTTVLNLTFPAPNGKTFNADDCQITDCTDYLLLDYTEFLNATLKSAYDMILGVNYSQLSLNHSAESLFKLIEKISNYSLISVYEFPTYEDFFLDPHLKKVYKYREIIITDAAAYVFCSNFYWYAQGNIAQFHKPAKYTREWIGTDDGARRYYFNSECILKYYQFFGENRSLAQELEREAKFLADDNAENGFAPQIISFHVGDHEGWILRKIIPGTPLSQLMEENSFYDPALILSNVLQQSITMEKKHLFHTDMRPRNILILNTGEAQLIDYGSVEYKGECYIEGYFAMILSAYEIFHRKQITLIRRFSPVYMMGADLHPLYQRWIKLILSVPSQRWTFPLFQQFLQEAKHGDPVCKMDYESFQLWLKEVYTLIKNRRMRLRRFEILLITKLNNQYSKRLMWHRVMDFLWKKFIILFDSISLPIKSLFKKANVPH